MTRIGINPARGKVSEYRPARVTVAVLTYLPDLSGYFAGRMEALKLVFASLQAHTTLPHDLLVFDNGSCSQVVAYLQGLQEAGQIDYLLHARQNIGKIGAFRLLFAAAPGEFIAYCDDDTLFYPGWLEAHLEILARFPKVGMVSGLPVRNAANHATNSPERLAVDLSQLSAEYPGLSVSRERRIPDEWERDWALSTGRDPEKHLQETREQLDLVFRVAVPPSDLAGLLPPQMRPSCEAIAAANHFQFVAPRQALLQALPQEWSGKLMGAMVELDEAIDSLGYLRLSTTQRYTRHLGNALSPEIIQESLAMGLPVSGEAVTPSLITRRRPLILRLPGARRLLMGLYNRLFKLLYQKS